jgi:hypothetical protein
MRRYGLIDNRNYTITKRGKYYVDKYKMLPAHIEKQDFLPNEVRLHKVEFVIEIKNKPSDWEKRRQGISKYEKYHEWKANNNFFNEGYVENIRVRTDNQNVYVYMEEFIGSTPEIVINQAISRLYEILPIIERDLRVELEKSRRWNIYVSDQHLALVRNQLAKFCLGEKINLKIYDENEELRAHIDNSKGLCELEFSHKIKGEEDCNNFQNYFEDILKNKPYLPSKLSWAVDFLMYETAKVTELLENSVKLQTNILKIMNPWMNTNQTFTPKIQERSNMSYVG